MVLSMRTFHQSRLVVRPGTKLGLYTKPMVLDSEVSGCRKTLEPELNGTGVCAATEVVGTKPCCSWR